MSGPLPVLLPEPTPDALAALEAALKSDEPGATLREVAAGWPDYIEAWARLGEWAYRQELDVDAFAFFRTAYHRGLDQLRRSGWRGTGYVPFSHRPNQGVMLAIRGLMLTSGALGEVEEARRCRKLLLESDPSDPFGVRALPESALSARLRLRD